MLLAMKINIYLGISGASSALEETVRMLLVTYLAILINFTHCIAETCLFQACTFTSQVSGS
jgi:formate/nitrite transporter FocA (FNT family)